MVRRDNMSNDEAIRRLTDIGRTIAAKMDQTEGSHRNFIALEMAINALVAQERRDDDDE